MIAERLDDPEIGPLLEPLAAVVEHLDRQVTALDRAVATKAKASPVCRRLMSVPGVGPLAALTYTAGVDDPGRSPRRAHGGPPRADAEALPVGRDGLVRPHQPRRRRRGAKGALTWAANVLIHATQGQVAR